VRSQTELGTEEKSPPPLPSRERGRALVTRIDADLDPRGEDSMSSRRIGCLCVKGVPCGGLAAAG
jgi:hypothetical protein